MERVSVIGLGKTGASIGLALRQWKLGTTTSKGATPLNLEIAGFDYDVETQKAASKLGCVDRAFWSLAEAVRDAGLVVLAVPTAELRGAMEDIASSLPDGAIVIDTAPYKRQCLHWAEQYLPNNVTYIGGHPVLSTEVEDETPSVDLFRGKTFALFPQSTSSPDNVDVVVGLVQAIGATPYFPDIAEHDAQMAATYTLPALASASLMHALTYGAGWRDLKGMATSDLVDITRLASLDAEQLTSMVEYSPEDAVRWLDVYINRLTELRDLAMRDDPEGHEQLARFLGDARKAREQWLHPETAASTEKQPSLVSANIKRLFLGNWRFRSRG